MGASLSAYDGPPLPATCRCACWTDPGGVGRLVSMRECNCVCDLAKGDAGGAGAKGGGERPEETRLSRALAVLRNRSRPR